MKYNDNTEEGTVDNIDLHTNLLQTSPAFPKTDSINDNISSNNTSSNSSDNNIQIMIHKKFYWREFIACSGSALLMCIAYLDPGNLESNLQASNLTGNKLLWILLWSHVLGLVMQNLASRIGLKSKNGIANVIRSKYGKKTSLFIWLNIELAIIGSDIQEVVGTSIALNILFGLKVEYGVPITFLGTAMFLLLTHYGMRVIEALFAFMLSLMGICFLCEVVISKPNIGSIAEGLTIPYVPKTAYVQAAAMLGAIIMPHNIYLHSGLVSRKVNNNLRIQDTPIKRLDRYFKLESFIALFTSLFINVCIYIAFAKVFYYENDMQPTENVSLLYAAKGLQSSLKNVAMYLWGLGLLAAGQSSTITGTIAGQMVMEGFFDLKVSKWLRALVTRSLALIPSTLVAVLARDKLDTLGEILNVFQSLQLPMTLVPLVLITSDKAIMQELRNTKLSAIIYKFLVIIIVAINVILVGSISKELEVLVRVFVIAIGVGYVLFVAMLYKNYK